MAHSIGNSGNAFVSSQRIGNYEVEMSVDPADALAGEQTKILLRIAGINGDDLVDVPISSMRILKDGQELYRSDPIVVSFGHHSHSYVFPEPGRYAVEVNLNDVFYSGEVIPIIFSVRVFSEAELFVQSWSIPITGAALAAVLGGIFFFLRQKKGKIAEP